MHDEERTKRWRVKDGVLIHDGDCRAWGDFGLCTCGLIHHLMPMVEDATKLMPDFWEQRAKHEEAIHKLECISWYGEWPLSQETIDRLKSGQS